MESEGEESRLSDVGKLYDVNGDGKLDEAEQAMRDMDETGRGYLTNEKVYELMLE
jgi:Ca2+-binding EF-hand superfamily protein